MFQRVESIIVTGTGSIELVQAEANRIFKMEPHIVSVCSGKYCSLFIPPNDHISQAQRIMFCNYLKNQQPNISFLWVEYGSDKKERIIDANNWE